jgi:probable phosphoglycerate mutase
MTPTAVPPTIYLCRHGDTAWSGERRLAGRTDIPLTPEGEANAVQLGRRLKPIAFDRVLVSPLARARHTADRAGFADTAVVDPRLAEIDFGEYEGRTHADINLERPGWTYARDGNPGGETVDHVGQRVDSVLSDLSATPGRVLIFAHSVLLRVFASRWLGLPPSYAQHFMLSPASISILAYDPVDDARAIASWNDRSHLAVTGAFA